jgi:hypothetical protein
VCEGSWKVIEVESTPFKKYKKIMDPYVIAVELVGSECGRPKEKGSSKVMRKKNKENKNEGNQVGFKEERFRFNE